MAGRETAEFLQHFRGADGHYYRYVHVWDGRAECCTTESCPLPRERANNVNVVATIIKEPEEVARIAGLCRNCAVKLSPPLLRPCDSCLSGTRQAVVVKLEGAAQRQPNLCLGELCLKACYDEMGDEGRLPSYMYGLYPVRLRPVGLETQAQTICSGQVQAQKVSGRWTLNLWEEYHEWLLLPVSAWLEGQSHIFGPDEHHPLRYREEGAFNLADQKPIVGYGTRSLTSRWIQPGKLLFGVSAGVALGSPMLRTVGMAIHIAKSCTAGETWIPPAPDREQRPTFQLTEQAAVPEQLRSFHVWELMKPLFVKIESKQVLVTMMHEAPFCQHECDIKFTEDGSGRQVEFDKFVVTKVFNSVQKPRLVTLSGHYADDPATPLTKNILVKKECMIRDAFVHQMSSLFNKIWEAEQVRYTMHTTGVAVMVPLYYVTIVGDDIAYVEEIPNFTPLSKVRDNNSIWRPPHDLENPWSNSRFYIPQLLGNLVLWFVLGIGDRHSDNMGFASPGPDFNGHFVSIDNGFIAGEKPFVDTTDLPLPIAAKNLLHKNQEWSTFVNTCHRALTVLQKYQREILTVADQSARVLNFSTELFTRTMAFLSRRLTKTLSVAQLEKLLIEGSYSKLPKDAYHHFRRKKATDS